MNGGAVRAVLAVAVIVAASCSIAYVYLSEEGSGSVTRGDLTVTGGLARSGVEVDEFAGVGMLTYTAAGTDIEWYVMDADGTFLVSNGDGTYSERAYEEAADGRSLRLTEPGTYLVSIHADGREVRSGTAVLDGTAVRTFSWSQTVSGTVYSYSVEYSFAYSDLASCRDDATAVRHQSSVLSPARFARVDGAVTDLEAVLSAEFEAVRGLSASGQAYADFLLSFVQCCIASPDPVSRTSEGTYVLDEEGGSGDMFLKGTDVYWAYPLETLASGYGGSEDASFLAAALFRAAGYESGLAVLSDRTVPYVGLSEFTPRGVTSDVRMSSKVLDATGTNIFFCDSRAGSSLYAGYVPTAVADEIAVTSMVYPVG